MENEIEIWKDVVGYEGLYEVSSFGNIRSLSRVLIRSDGREYNHVGKNMRFGMIGHYKNTTLSGGPAKRKTFLVHRIVATAFHPNPEGKNTVNHIDANKLNNMASNLEWATQKENNRHARDLGLCYSNPRTCEDHPGTLLKNKDVLEIKKAYMDSDIGKLFLAGIVKRSKKRRDLFHELAAKYNTTYEIVRRIIGGYSFKSL